MTLWRPCRFTAVVACSVLAALMVPSMASGVGRTYEVIQCDPLNRGISGVALDDAPAYAVRQMCGDPQNDHAIKITNTRFARHGRSGRVRWSTNSPSLRIVGASLQARLRRDEGHVPRLLMADARGQEVARVATGVSHATGFRDYSWHSASVRAEQFVAHLRCEHRGGCQRSDVAKTWLRNVHLEVADYSDPSFEVVGGSLLQGGWLRGEQSVFALARDLGSGLHSIVVSVNGTSLSRQRGTCDAIPETAYATTFAVCPPELETRNQPTTAHPPFQDGVNSVFVCARDFAGNGGCLQRKIYTDNSPPSAAFSNAQNPNDPELIRALVSDTTSGVESGRIFYRGVGTQTWRPLATTIHAGELRTRINSTLDPPGRYEFMVRAIDVAGNGIASTRRANGQTMILTFPLKSGVRLNAHLAGGSSRPTVGYGQSSRVSGVLEDALGEPLPNQSVTVTEFFGEGALIDRRIRTVTTDEAGR